MGRSSRIEPDPSAAGRDPAPGASRSVAGRLRDLISLTKPGIVAMLAFTALVAALLAKGPVLTAATAAGVVGLALAASGGAAINMWFDRDVDAVMERTRHRPLAAARLPASVALVLGVVLAGGGTAVALLGANALTASLTLGGAAYYALVYTVVLKRRSSQAVVWGGAAGAAAPLVGWAAATGALAPGAWILAAIVFLWTPAHFWALALDRVAEYRAAGIPVLPVERGGDVTLARSRTYGRLTLLASLLLWPVGLVPLWWAVAALVLGLGYARMPTLVARGRMAPRRAFHLSVAYLAALWLLLLVAAVTRGGVA